MPNTSRKTATKHNVAEAKEEVVVTDSRRVSRKMNHLVLWHAVVPTFWYKKEHVAYDSQILGLITSHNIHEDHVIMHEVKTVSKTCMQNKGHPKTTKGIYNDCRNSSIKRENQKNKEADIYSMNALLMPDIIEKHN